MVRRRTGGRPGRREGAADGGRPGGDPEGRAGPAGAEEAERTRPAERAEPADHGEGAERIRERIRTALEARETRRIAHAECPARAAVALVLRPADPSGVRRRGGGGGRDGGDARVLFVQRAERSDDPWSGHMALPGGRQSASDADLVATALRETREETSLRLRREAVLGPLDDVRPLSRRLPPIAVTPFAAWYAGDEPVRGNREIRDHVWVPLDALDDPRRRSVLRLERSRRSVAFPSIEYGTYTIWGLTFEIVSRFLDRLRRAPP